MTGLRARVLTMLIGALSCSAAVWPAGVPAKETPPALTRLFSRLRPIFERHYPGASSQLQGDRVEFAHDTRTFLIHERLKTGEWQEAREVRGPNRGGILCRVELSPGRYGGAAVLPQVFDRRYFETLVMAVPSPDETSYFYVHLSYPAEMSPGFMKEFREIVEQGWAAER